MRTIKFRAWDKEKNKMYSGIPMPFVFDKYYEPFYYDEVSTDNLKMHQWEKCEWMQFTGLLDKNGKEIYEGDIVKCQQGCPHEIIFKQEHGGTYFGGMPTWYLGGLGEGYSWSGDEELIGNIYENSDLLSNK